MVSYNVYKPTSGGAYVEGVCLTTDTMPVAGIANGSILFAVDPEDGGTIRYMFDQSTASWVEATCPCSGGGSGGGGGGGDISDYLLEVSVTDLGEGEVGISASWNELKAADAAGKFVYLRLSNSAEDDGDWTESHVTLFLTRLSAMGWDDIAFYSAYFGPEGDGIKWEAEDPDAPMHQAAA